MLFYRMSDINLIADCVGSGFEVGKALSMKGKLLTYLNSNLDGQYFDFTLFNK